MRKSRFILLVLALVPVLALAPAATASAGHKHEPRHEPARPSGGPAPAKIEVELTSCHCCDVVGPGPSGSYWIDVEGFPGVQALGVIRDGLIQPAGPHLQMRPKPAPEAKPSPPKPPGYPAYVPFPDPAPPRCGGGRRPGPR